MAPRSAKQPAPKKLPTKKNEKQRLFEPPFSLYGDSDDGKEPPSFNEGWSSLLRLLRGRKNIVVLTGAGISVSCGIPDFRSKGSGLYSTLDAEELGLSCPEDLFDASFFQENPEPFYKFARQLYFPLLGKDGSTGADDKMQQARVRPSDAHKLLALLEQKKMLLRVYSQNIDGLEEEAGVSSKKIVYAHGSLQWATCCTCKRKVSCKEIESDILNGTVARCKAPIAPKNTSRASSPVESTLSREPSARVAKRPRNKAITNHSYYTNSDGESICGGVLKPGVTFFGEALHNNVKNKLESDRDKVDALIVIGTSLSVAPMSKVIGYLPADIPRILINRTIVHPPEDQAIDDDDCSSTDSSDNEFRNQYVFDAYLLGFCDDVTRALGKKLFPTDTSGSDSEEGELLATVLEGNGDDSSYTVEDWESVQVPPDRVFLFPGAHAPSGTAEEIAYREIAHCDGCSVRIAGTIRKCSSCFDYDLCQKCYPILSATHYNGEHHFTAEAAPVVKRSSC